MSQTLTQPEEIDCIWRAMVWSEEEADALGGEPVAGVVYDFDASSYAVAKLAPSGV